jgi:membrane associated rhomboid family serine protease
MRTAAAGHRCVECVQAGARTIRQPRTTTPRLGARQRSDTPVVTYALIATNVAAFITQMASGNLEKQLTLWRLAVADGQWYRLATAYVVGPPLEMWLGRLRFGALYALSGLGGSVLVYLLSPLSTATAGPPGAIFGLFDATFVVAKRLTLDVRWVAAVIVINLVFTFVVPAVSSQLISWQAHVGELVTGGVVAAAYVYPPRERRNLIQTAVTIVALAVFAGLIWWRTNDLLAEFCGHVNLS